MEKNLNKKVIKEVGKIKPIEKREKELTEMDRVAKMLVKRDLELSETIAQLEKQRNELDRIAKLLVRRDFELSEVREKRELELEELGRRTKELEGSRMALINMLEDVEEAGRKAEEEKNKTLAVITNFADGLLVLNPEGNIYLINPKAEDFLKAKAKEVIGKHFLELTYIPTISPLINLLRKKNEGIYRKELPIDTHITLEISTLPIKSGEEKFGTLVILHDITREKLIEKLKTEFVSIAAHQLRTPLSAIKWTLRMLLDGDLGKINPEQKEFLEKTYSSNERMIALINDLLDVTRIEEGRYLYKPVLSDIEEILQLVISSYKEEIRKKKIKLKIKKPERKLPKLIVDREKINFAIQNLLDNAIRYTPAGGEVTVSLKFAKKEIEISVKDNGIGIPKSQQERVFTKFFRGSNVKRMDVEGAGLGLFITKNIIESHGGKIWFKSKEGKGTTFYFTLPIKKELEESLKKV